MFSNHLEVLKSFLSHDTNVQREAENTLNKLAQENPAASMELYITSLDSQEKNIAELAAVSIKKYHLQSAKDFDQVPKEHLNLLQKKLISMLNEGTHSLKFYKRSVELLVLLYGGDNEMFGHILKDMLSFENSQNSNIKISIMYFLQTLCETCFKEEDLHEASGLLIELFGKYLTDQDMNVGISAVKALISFLSSIEDQTFVKKFSDALPVLLQTLTTVIKQDEDASISVLQSLSELVEAHPTFVKPIIDNLLLTLIEIMKAKELTDGTRNQAMNCIEMLSNHCDVALRKSEVFKKQVIPTFMEVLCEINEISLDEWLQDLDGQTISKNDPYFVAQDTLAKISDFLRSKFLLPQCIPYITQCIQNDNWYAKHAGYVAIGVLAEGSSAFFKSELGQIMQLIIPGFDHQDPRVVYAAMTATALLCEEYAPDLQKTYNKPILETLIRMINDERYFRLQLHGTKVIVNFCQKIVDLEEEDVILTPYAASLLDGIHKLFQKSIQIGSNTLLEEVLNAISSVSAVIDTEFAKYYDLFLPGLKHILENIPNTDEKQTNIRLSSIECMGFIMTSMRNLEGFEQEVDLMMEYFINHQKKIEKDDPEQAVVMDAYSQVSSHMKEKFAKYMPLIYPRILESLDMEVKIVTHKNENFKEMAQKKFVMTGSLESNILTFDNFVFDTSAFAIKLAASTTIFNLSRNLEKAFYPYITYTIEKITKYFGFHVKEIATKSLKTIKGLILACENESDQADILATCIPSLLEAIQSSALKEDVAQVHYIFKQINKGLDFLTQPLINENTIAELINGLSQGLTFCDQEKKKIMKETANMDDYDDDKKEEIELRYEEVNNIMQIVMEISGRLLRFYKEKIEGLIGNGIAPYYYNYLVGKESSIAPSELLYSICLFIDILEYCSMNMFEKAVGEATKKFLEFCKKPQTQDILHSCVYGFGVISRRMSPQDFKQVKSDILQIISNIVTASDASSSKKAELTDNAYSALGKIALYQSEKNDKFSEEIMLKFLQFIPLKNDYEEAQTIHRILLEETLKKNESLFNSTQDIQNALIQAITNIQKTISNNPECDILDDEGKNLLQQVINSA